MSKQAWISQKRVMAVLGKYAPGGAPPASK